MNTIGFKSKMEIKFIDAVVKKYQCTVNGLWVGFCGYNKFLKKWQFIGEGKNFTFKNKSRLIDYLDEKGIESGISDV